MDSSGTLTAILMATPDAKKYYGANFATVEVWREGKKIGGNPPYEKEKQKSPNSWFSKIKQVGMRSITSPTPRIPSGR